VTARARKARSSSVRSCGCYVTTGQLIVYRDGRWLCLEHALAAVRQRTPRTLPPTSRKANTP
jgi:hypothetical protein